MSFARPAHWSRHQFVTQFIEGFNDILTSTGTPVVSARSGSRVKLHPIWKRRLNTAHANCGRLNLAELAPSPFLRFSQGHFLFLGLALLLLRLLASAFRLRLWSWSCHDDVVSFRGEIARDDQLPDRYDAMSATM